MAFALDGTDNQDPILGIIVINPNLDSLSETKITTQNYDAEFGKAVASVVTAQTKSGSNNFHGSGFWYRASAANLALDPFTQSPNAPFPQALTASFPRAPVPYPNSGSHMSVHLERKSAPSATMVAPLM